MRGKRRSALLDRHHHTGVITNGDIFRDSMARERMGKS
jgi:hypothetical protein